MLQGTLVGLHHRHASRIGFRQRLAYHLFGRDAKTPLQHGVHIDATAFAVIADQEVRQVFRQGAEFLLAGAQRLLGPPALDGDADQVDGLFDDGNVECRRRTHLTMIDGKGTQHLTKRRTDRLRPACSQPSPGREILVALPIGMRHDVLDNDTLPGRGSRPATADANADFQSVDRRVVELRQAWRDTLAETFAPAIQQQDAADHLGLDLLHAADNGFEYAPERNASSQQLQRVAAKLFIPLGQLALGDVAKCHYNRMRPGFAVREQRLCVGGYPNQRSVRSMRTH